MLENLFETDKPKTRQQENWLKMLSAIPDTKIAFGDEVRECDIRLSEEALQLLEVPNE